MAPGKRGSRTPRDPIGRVIATRRFLWLGDNGEWGIRYNPDANRVEIRGGSVFDELSSRRAPKPSCLVATTANINLASAPATIDGVAPSIGPPPSRICVKNQTAGAENGIYDWNGAGSAMTRCHNADEASELEGAVVLVRQGTDNADKQFQIVTDNITLDTTVIAWTEVTSTEVSQRISTFGSAFTSPSVAAAGGVQSFNLTGFGDRGTNIQRLQITPSTDVDDYTVELFREDTHTTLQYQLLNVTTSAAAAVALLDELIGLMWDDDSTGELHMRITNDDPANAATFDIEVEGATLPR